MNFTKVLDSYQLDTRESVGSNSRSQSVQSSILIRDMDSRLVPRQSISRMGKSSNFGVLTQHSEHDDALARVQRLTEQNKCLNGRIYQLQDKIRDESQVHLEKIRLRQIAESEYICGMKSMYQRNTQMSQQLIVYERQLKSSMYKICHLEKQLQESNNKSLSRVARQHQLECKIKEIQERYQYKFSQLQQHYEKGRAGEESDSRELKFRVESMQEDLKKERCHHVDSERANIEKIQILLSQRQNTQVVITRYRQQNQRLENEVRVSRENIRQLEIQNQQLLRSASVRVEENKPLQNDVCVNSTIAALAIQNITLKQQHQEKERALFVLEDKVKSYQRQFNHSRNKQNEMRHNYRRSHSRFGSTEAESHNYSTHVYELTKDPVWGTIQPSPMMLNRQLVKRERGIERGHRREGVNETLIRRCKELNRSMFA